MCYVESHSGRKILVAWDSNCTSKHLPDELVKPAIFCHDSPCIVCESRKEKPDGRFRDFIALKQFEKYGKITIRG